MTNSGFKPVSLPFAESKDYIVCLEPVLADSLPSGKDWQYAVINKLTAVVEARVGGLPLAVVVMQNSQQSLDKVRTGEMNGYVVPKEAA